jgi:hypothetical protein
MKHEGGGLILTDFLPEILSADKEEALTQTKSPNIPDKIRLSRKMIETTACTNAFGDELTNFGKNIEALVFIKKGSIIILVDDYELVVEYQKNSDKIFCDTFKLKTFCQKVRNGGKTNSQLELEERASKLLNLLNSHL